jgi:hypothetical protein
MISIQTSACKKKSEDGNPLMLGQIDTDKNVRGNIAKCNGGVTVMETSIS